MMNIGRFTTLNVSIDLVQQSHGPSYSAIQYGRG